MKIIYKKIEEYFIIANVFKKLALNFQYENEYGLVIVLHEVKAKYEAVGRMDI